MSKLAKRITITSMLLALGLASTGCTICRPGCGTAVCGDAVACPSHAFEQWKGCGPCQGPKLCPCTGPECDDCGCEPGCECEPSCIAEPGCVVDSCCGCDSACGCGSTCSTGCCTGVLYSLKYTVGKLFGGVFGCNGCDGELYWSEWHNDPPRCCDPCDRCGNWIGPAASYRAPYKHPYSVASGQASGETAVR